MNDKLSLRRKSRKLFYLIVEVWLSHNRAVVAAGKKKKFKSLDLVKNTLGKVFFKEVIVHVVKKLENFVSNKRTFFLSVLKKK